MDTILNFRHFRHFRQACPPKPWRRRVKLFIFLLLLLLPAAAAAGVKLICDPKPYVEPTYVQIACYINGVRFVDAGTYIVDGDRIILYDFGLTSIEDISNCSARWSDNIHYGVQWSPWYQIYRLNGVGGTGVGVR